MIYPRIYKHITDHMMLMSYVLCLIGYITLRNSAEPFSVTSFQPQEGLDRRRWNDGRNADPVKENNDETHSLHSVQKYFIYTTKYLFWTSFISFICRNSLLDNTSLTIFIFFLSLLQALFYETNWRAIHRHQPGNTKYQISDMTVINFWLSCSQRKNQIMACAYNHA